jgi:tripartite-type tricarboxylate transporter receptor subunit TctC
MIFAKDLLFIFRAVYIRHKLRTLVITLIPAMSLQLAGIGLSNAQPATSYPDKSIRFIVPFPPGGPADIQSRIIGQKMSMRWKQPVVIDNKPGAGGSIGVEFVSRAPADGYTLLYTTSGPISVNPSLSNSSFDSLRDLAPVSLTSTLSSVMVVNPSLNIKTVAELINYAKANPDKLNYASSGNGSTSHLAMEQFNRMAGVKITRIPYKGAAPAINDLLGGNVQVMLMGLTGVLPFMNTGKLTPLGVSSLKPSPQAPSVPTIASYGLPGFEANNWLGVFAPPNTPESIIRKINLEIYAIMQLPDVKEKFFKEGFETLPNKNPAQFKDFLQNDIAKWSAIIKEANITAE